MPIFIPFLISFLSSLPGKIGDYFKGQQDLKKAVLDNELAMEVEKGKLIAQGIITQGELGQAQLAATSSSFKQFIYTLMLSPVIINCFSPELGMRIFTSLDMVPEWYMGLIVTIGLAMWGISSDKLRDIIQSRRDYSLQKTNLRLNHKLFYDTLRSVSGPIGQHEVDLYEKAINAMQNDSDKAS